MAVKAEAEAAKKATALKNLMVSLIYFGKEMINRLSPMRGKFYNARLRSVADIDANLTFVSDLEMHALVFPQPQTADALGTIQKMRQDSHVGAPFISTYGT